MAATKDDISGWFDRGLNEGATHMLVVCDTFDYDDYPVFVMPGTDVKDKLKEYDGPNMQKVMEVYNLAQSKSDQMGDIKAWHL